MRRACFVMFLFSLSLLVGNRAFAGGDLQVLCASGVKIYVDGSFRGTTDSFQGGLFIEGLSAGQHTLLAKLSGANDQTKSFFIQDGQLTEVRLSFARQQVRVESLESTDSATIEVKTGNLEIRSVPPYPKATVKIDGQERGTGDLKVSGLTIGKHKVLWIRGGKSHSFDVNVCADSTVSLKLDFRTKDVSVDSPCQSGGVGTWTDPNTKLDWQLVPTGRKIHWSKAQAHCAGLNLGGHRGWRLPTIGELRSLIRGCPKTEAGGSCNIGAGQTLKMHSRDHASCFGCAHGDGPADRCYWPDKMQGTCLWYQSSSFVEDVGDTLWGVGFGDACVSTADVKSPRFVRCVR